MPSADVKKHQLHREVVVEGAFTLSMLRDVGKRAESCPAQSPSSTTDRGAQSLQYAVCDIGPQLVENSKRFALISLGNKR